MPAPLPLKALVRAHGPNREGGIMRVTTQDGRVVLAPDQAEKPLDVHSLSDNQFLIRRWKEIDNEYIRR